MISSIKTKNRRSSKLELQQKQKKVQMKAIEETINHFSKPENEDLINILLQQVGFI